MQLITYQEIKDRYGDKLARRFLTVIESAAARRDNVIHFDFEKRLRHALEVLNDIEADLAA